MRWSICLLFAFSFFLAETSAQQINRNSNKKRNKIISHIPFQFAGNIGFVSAGLGYTSNKQTYQLAFLYGYVPASIAETPVHIISVRNIFSIARIPVGEQTLFPYLGLGLTLEVGGISYFTFPSYYPRNYYFQKALHIIGYGGFRYQIMLREDKFIKGFELYTEAGSFDAYIWYKAISREIKFNQIISLAIGVNLLL